jgi:hypothetical protein
MPIFGQVWLWSLAAFLLGAVLTWVLVVLPVRKRIDTLESRLSAIRADVKLNAAAERSRPAERPAEPLPSAQGIVPGFGDLDARDEIRPDALTRAYALPGVQNVPSTPYVEPDGAAERGVLSLSGDEPPGGATEYLGTAGSPLAGPTAGHDWFDEQSAAPESDRRLVDGEHDDEHATVFAQRTTPIPAALIRQLDESAPAHLLEDDHLVDDLAEDTAQDSPRSATTRLMSPPPVAEPDIPEPDRARHATFEPGGLGTNGIAAKPDAGLPAEPEAEKVAASAAHRSTIAELTSRPDQAEPPAPSVPRGLTIEPERTPSALPKRIPAKPQHNYHPFGVQTVTPAVSLSNTGTGGERIRSLFEPIVPAEDDQTAVPPPPPPRLQPTSSESRPSAPGPFGPGSAMPLPGGASPSPEFTVKASVTALRYCTPESPQFGRTVAEVWFRTAADAERVGFRPVG